MMALSNVFALILLVLIMADAQFRSSHEGDYETNIDGYRFQFHGDTHLLLILHKDNCYISDVPSGSALEKLLTNRASRKRAFTKLIPVVEASSSDSDLEMDQVHSRYQDPLLRALCFTSRLHQLDIASVFSLTPTSQHELNNTSVLP